jgi:hypothetical protein
VSLGNPDLARGRQLASIKRTQEADQKAENVAAVIAEIRRGAAKELTLREIAAALEARSVSTPRGGTSWTATAVKRVLDRGGGTPR